MSSRWLNPPARILTMETLTGCSWSAENMAGQIVCGEGLATRYEPARGERPPGQR